MGADIDRLDALAIDHDLSARRLGSSLGSGYQVAANEQEACKRTRCCLQNIPAGCHLGLLHLRSAELATGSLFLATRRRIANARGSPLRVSDAVAIARPAASIAWYHPPPVPRASPTVAHVKATCGQPSACKATKGGAQLRASAISSAV